MVVARKFFVSGLVQGVGFRYFAQRLAARYQLLGYVRNLADGRVEAFAEGRDTLVEAFKNDLNAGPQFSRVDNVEEIVVEPSGDFSSFRIER